VKELVECEGRARRMRMGKMRVQNSEQQKGVTNIHVIHKIGFKILTVGAWL